VSTQSRIDRYVPEELLGRAGLVDTFRVRRGDDGAPAVLKVLFLDRAPSETSHAFTQRFLSEARRARDAQPKGSARILEVSDDVEAAYVATEFVPGGDLAQLMKEASASTKKTAGLPPTLAGLLCSEVARVLAAAHDGKTPLFHLGLAPGNVRVTEQGQVVVLDFGLMATQRGLRSCPAEKWAFVAPELFGRGGEDLSEPAARAADAYGLGRLLHFLLTGDLPAPARNVAELAERARRPWPDPKGIPQNILSALRALTAVDPNDRPSSLSEVAGWLSRGTANPDETRAAIAAALARPAAMPAPSPVATSSNRTRAPARPAPQARPQPDAGAQGRALPRTPAEPGQAEPEATAVASSRRPPWYVFALTAVLAAAAFAGWRSLASRARQDGPSQVRSALAPGSPEDPGAATGWQADGGAALRDPELPSFEQVQAQGFEGAPSRVPHHLYFDTNPGQADVWIDGVLRGRTPVDLVLGPGGHRVVAIKHGYRMVRAVYDTTHGEYARRELQRAGFPHFGDGLLSIECSTPNRFPVMLDDEETGLLCPVSRLSVTSGKHHVGIYVPARRANVAVEVDVPKGRQLTRVTLKE
jgi:hypothetical protein